MEGEMREWGEKSRDEEKREEWRGEKDTLKQKIMDCVENN